MERRWRRVPLLERKRQVTLVVRSTATLGMEPVICYDVGLLITHFYPSHNTGKLFPYRNQKRLHRFLFPSLKNTLLGDLMKQMEQKRGNF